MAETTKKVNTIKSIGKKIANNGDANDYIYVPIGADSDNVDRPDGTTVEESLSSLETEKVEIIPVETLPASDIKVYPFIYALINPSESKGIFYEYRNNKWIKYGNGADGIWVGTREECAKEFDNIETGTIVIIVKKGEDSGDTDTHTHDYVEFVTKAPTYSEPGIKTCTCFLCGESHTEEIPALVDSVKPAGVIRIAGKEYATWKDTVSFDTYYKDNQTVTIEASDNETGVKEIAYHLANIVINTSNIGTVNWIQYTEPFTIEPNNNYIVYARITDNSDNVTYICTDGIVMDNIPPVFEGLEDGGTYPTGTVLTVEEGATLTVNGEVVDLVNNTYTFTEVMDNSQLSLVDKAGNSSNININIETELIDEAPEGAHTNWNYTLNDIDNTIELKNYTGEETDITVYGSYKINEKVYRTKIASNIGISPYMFEENYNVQTITFSKKIDTSNVTNMSNMFSNCVKLTSLDIENFNTSNVTNMRSMFGGCNSLISLDIRNFDTSNVTNMSSMFMGLSNITSLDLSNFSTSNVTNMSSIFSNCVNLTAVYVSEDTWIITQADTTDMFKWSENISDVTYV